MNSRSSFAFLLLLAPALVAKSAWAGDRAAAQQLFSDGKRLMQAGSYREACLKFDESQQQDPGVGTEFNLADCNERIGNLASAWAGFLDVAALSRNAGQTAREEAARSRAEALEPKLLRLTIRPRVLEPRLEILRDGIVVGRAQWNSAVPVDPGEHKLVARAPGKISWEKTVRVTTEGGSVNIEIPALVLAPVEKPAPVNVVVPPPVAPLKESTTGDGQRIAGIATAGLGVVGLGLGTAFGISSKTHRDDADSHCRGNLCDQTGVDSRDSAIRAGNVSTVLFITGGAAVLGGALLYFTSPSGESSRGSLKATPLIARNGGGLTLQGTFP